jgi:transposase InsO family protein
VQVSRHARSGGCRTKRPFIPLIRAKGWCHDNACAEGFFHTLKVKAIHGERFATRQELRRTVFEYLKVDYDRTRRHSANGYVSPEAFGTQQVA